MQISDVEHEKLYCKFVRKSNFMNLFKLCKLLKKNLIGNASI